MQFLVTAVALLTFSLMASLANGGPFDSPDIAGEWSPVYDGDVVAVHMILMPNGKILFYEEGGQGRPVVDEIRIWDPIALELTTPALPPYDLFCSGHSVLPDGRIFIQGGQDGADANGEARATIYDPITNTWDDSIPKMNAGRWYATNTILPNGDVLVLNGAIDSYANKNNLPQIWELQSKTWRNLVTAEEAAPMGLDFYPRMFVMPDGRLFKAGPDRDSWFLDTSGTGKWTRGPNMNWNGGGGFRGYGSSVMYAEGKVLTVGGGEQPATATAEVIDLNLPNPTWQTVAPMHHPRRHLTATLLADGKVLVTGGTASSGFNNAAEAVLTAEIWDPETNVWTEMAPQSNPRIYHSTAVLLPDGRVQIAGGGRPAADGGVDNPNLEIYSPPYLFKGPRPVILNAPDKVSFGDRFSVAINNPESITAIHFMRLGATTHAFNQTQGINKLTWTVTGNGLEVQAPVDPNRAQPGYYMLFVLADGVPSVAKMIQFGDALPPTSPTGLTAGNITASSVALAWNAATDNIAVASYNIYRDGTYIKNVSATNTLVGAMLSDRDYSFTVAAVDLFGNVSAPGNALTVRTAAPGQNPPIAIAGADQLAVKNQNFTLDGTASSDIDGQLLTYEWYLDGSIIATTPVIQEAIAQPGTYTYTLTVSDGEFSSSDQLVVTVVDALNVLPNGDFSDGLTGWITEVMQGGAAQFANENGVLHANISAAGTDYWSIQLYQIGDFAAGETYSLDFDARTDNGPRSFTLMIEHNGGDYTKYFTEVVPITATTSMQHFHYEWQQSVDDNNVKIGFYLGNAGVNDIWFDNVFLRRGSVTNSAPLANAGNDLNGFVGETILLNGSASADADNGPQALSYFWAQTAGPVVSLNNNQSVNPSFTPTQAGNYVFSLVVNDGELDSNTDQVIVTIGELVNRQPIARAGTDRLAVVGDVVLLDGTLSSDQDNGPAPLTYLWTQVGGPSIALSSATSAQPTFSPLISGSYVFSLIVSDGDLESSVDTLVVTVNEANLPPIAIAGMDKLAYQGDVVLLDGSQSTDPDSGPADLSFTWLQLSGPSTILNNAAASIANFAASQTGVYEFTLQVSDGDRISLVDSIIIEVQAVPNIAPVAIAGNNQTVTLGQPVTLNGGASFDPDLTSPALGFAWTQTGGPAVSLSGATTGTTNFLPTQTGLYEFRLVVSDGDLVSTQRSIDASRSLLITDRVILEQFSIASVLQKLLDDSADTTQTPAGVIQNLAALRQGCADFNGFPQQDSRDTLGFCSEPGISLDVFEAGNDASLNYYQPIALVNRFDLADAEGADCGEYRIAFAGNSIFDPRVNFFIFEAKLPNPNPQLGFAGCRPIMDFWADLTHQHSVLDRAAALHDFYFTGVAGFAPAIQADHFLGSAQGSGSVRLNARVDQSTNWVFMQFHNATPANCAPTCSFTMEQAPLEDTPFPELAGSGTGSLQAQVFQNAVIASMQLPGQQLLADSISQLSIELPETVYLGRQHSPVASAPGVADFASAEFTQVLQTQLNQLGSSLTPQNILNRIDALSCAGCHNQQTNALGAPLSLNTADQQVEFLSINLEAGPNGQRFTVKPAMQNVFLPERADILLNTMDQSRVIVRVAAAANTVPIANAGADQTVTVGATVVLSGATSSDADAGPSALVFQWVQTAGPAAPLTNTTAISPEFTPTSPGTYVFALTVNDGAAASAADSVTVVVEPEVNTTDSDNDGVPDTRDQCANSNGAVDVNGCSLVVDVLIQSEDYVGFYDTTAGNSGNRYRTDNVDVETTTDSGGGFNVGWTAAGEWLTYSVVLSAGTYSLKSRVASSPGGGAYRVLLDGVQVASDTVGATGGWQNWQTHNLPNITVSAGTHLVRINITGGNFNLNWLQFAAVNLILDSDHDGVTDNNDACPTTPAGTVVASNGCPPLVDSDLDGVGDNQDLCANTPAATRVDASGCAIPDTDGDGVADDLDQCPSSPASEVVDASGCTVVIDSDNDGVPDEQDLCPFTSPADSVDSDGCSLITQWRVQAEDYVNYMDTTGGNSGNSYRTDNVDIEPANDTGGGYNVGWTEPNEWLEYSITLPQGRYRLTTRVASSPGNGAYTIAIDGQTVATDTVAATGGWQSWQTHVLPEFTTTAGQHVLRVNITRGAFNLNWIELNLVE